MTYRKFTDLPRLSGRPGQPAARPEPQRVFRRFFDLLERFERPQPGPGPSRPGSSGDPRAKRR